MEEMTLEEYRARFVRRPRGRRHAGPTEHEEQVALVQLAQTHAGRYPALRLLFAIPNGGERHKAVAAQLVAEGVRAGVPDLCLPVRSADGRYAGLFVEMKVDGGATSPEQNDWIAALRAEGWRVEVCYGCSAAWRVVTEHLGIRG